MCGGQGRALMWSLVNELHRRHITVFATPMTSRFAIAAGHVCAWITDGDWKPAWAMAPMIVSKSR